MIEESTPQEPKVATISTATPNIETLRIQTLGVEDPIVRTQEQPVQNTGCARDQTTRHR